MATTMNPAGALFRMQQWQFRLLPVGFSGRLAERYEMEEPEIGQGRFGVVRRCRRKGVGGGERLLAVKSISKLLIQSGRHANALQLELDALAGLRGHPGIVQLLDVVEEEQTIHIVTELCDQGDLFDYLSSAVRLKESDARIMFRRIAAAVEYCHAHCLLHRDIKPENIFLSTLSPDEQECNELDAEDAGDQGRRKPSDSGLPSGIGPSASLASIMSPRLVRDGSGLDLADLAPLPQGSKFPLAKGLMPKLGDFGLAVLLDGGKRVSGRMGSSYYMAPEVVRGDSYGLPADIWSLGVILHIMLSGFLPFCGQTSVQTFAAICTGHLDFTTPLWQRISAPAKDLVQRMLDVNECGRPTASELLAHPWLTGHSLPQQVDFLPGWVSQPREGTVVTASKGGAAAVGLDDAEDEVSSQLPGHQPIAMELLLQQQQHQRRRQLVQHQEEQRDLLHRQQQQQQQWHQWQMWQQQMQFQQHQQQLVQRQLQQQHQQRMYQQYQQYQQYHLSQQQRLRDELGKQLAREQERQQREDAKYVEQAAPQDTTDLQHDVSVQLCIADGMQCHDSRNLQGRSRIVLSPQQFVASWRQGQSGEAVLADMSHLISGQGLADTSQDRLRTTQPAAMPSASANHPREAGRHNATTPSELHEQQQQREGYRVQVSSGFSGEALDRGKAVLESALAHSVSLESRRGKVQREAGQRQDESNGEQVRAFPETSGQVHQDAQGPDMSTILASPRGLDTTCSKEPAPCEAPASQLHRTRGSSPSLQPESAAFRLGQVHDAGASCTPAAEVSHAGAVGTREPGSEAASQTLGSGDLQTHGAGAAPAEAEAGNKTPAPVSFSWLRLGTPPAKPVAARLLTPRKPQDLASLAEATGSRQKLPTGVRPAKPDGRSQDAMHFDLSAVGVARQANQGGKLPATQQQLLEVENLRTAGPPKTELFPSLMGASGRGLHQSCVHSDALEDGVGLSLSSVPMSTILEASERRVDTLAEVADGEGAQDPEGVSMQPSSELGARIGSVLPGKEEAELRAPGMKPEHEARETEPEASLERRPTGAADGALQRPASSRLLHGSTATVLEQQVRVQGAAREKGRGAQTGIGSMDLLVDTVKPKGQRGTRVFHAERPEVSARAAALALGHWRAVRVEPGSGIDGARLQGATCAKAAAKQEAAEHVPSSKLECRSLGGERRLVEVPEDKVKTAEPAEANVQPMEDPAIMLQQMWEPRTPAYSFATGIQSGEQTAAGSAQLVSCLQDGTLGSWTGPASGMLPPGAAHPVRQAQAQAEARFMSLFQPLSLHGVPRALDRSGSMNVSMVHSAGAAVARTAPDAPLPAMLKPHLDLANSMPMPVAAIGAAPRVAPPMLAPYQPAQVQESVSMSMPSSAIDHSQHLAGAATAEPGLHKRKWGACPDVPPPAGLETPVLAVPPFAPYGASVGRDGVELLPMGGLRRRIGAFDSQAQAASGGSFGTHFVGSFGRSKREVLEGQALEAVHLKELLSAELHGKATSK